MFAVSRRADKRRCATGVFTPCERRGGNHRRQDGVTCGMRRFVPLLLVLATGCAGGHHHVVARTGLTVVVHRGHSVSRYALTCRPAGGTAPHPAAACRALEDFVRRGRSMRGAKQMCLCALYVNRIVLHGVVDGRRLDGPVEVSGCAACGMGRRAAADVARAFAAVNLSPG
jgi:hypothetical protein